jgi:hypothetical protein
MISLIFFLDADHALARARPISMAMRHAAQERLGVVEQFFVLVQQRFAFGGVGNHQRDLGSELHRRGKAAAAGADDAQFLKAIGGGMPAKRFLLDRLATFSMLQPFRPNLKIQSRTRLTLNQTVLYAL